MIWTEEGTAEIIEEEQKVEKETTHTNTPR